MTIARIILAGTAALTILGSAAFAEEAAPGARAGTLTKIDRTSGTVALQETQSGTIGASGGAAEQEFKVQRGLSLEPWHVGDRVSFTASDAGGVKTITKIEAR